MAKFLMAIYSSDFDFIVFILYSIEIAIAIRTLIQITEYSSIY